MLINIENKPPKIFQSFNKEFFIEILEVNIIGTT